jgi:hypothetical protein
LSILISTHEHERATITNKKSLALQLNLRSQKIIERYCRPPKLSLTDTNTGRMSPLARFRLYLVAKLDTQPDAAFSDIALLANELHAHHWREDRKADTWGAAAMAFMKECSNASNEVLRPKLSPAVKDIALRRVEACIWRLRSLIRRDPDGPHEELMFQEQGRGVRLLRRVQGWFSFSS